MSEEKTSHEDRAPDTEAPDAHAPDDSEIHQGAPVGADPDPEEGAAEATSERSSEEPGLGERALHEAQALEERADKLREQATAINRGAVTFIQDRPAVAIFGAFGIGYFFGSLAARRWII